MKLQDKHLSYFELVDAFSKDGCPICFLIKDKVEKYFDNLLYENVNDIPFREKFRKNYGFCTLHSYKLLSYNDALAVSILYKDLLGNVIKNLELKSKRDIHKNKKCDVCEFIKDLEARYISIILNYINDKEFKEKFLNSKGLCVPHFGYCINNMKKIPEFFIKFHLEKYKQIFISLEKYIESNNFAKSKKIELNEEEKTAWKKIIKILYKEFV